jgi:exonuclease V gamma subunit
LHALGYTLKEAETSLIESHPLHSHDPSYYQGHTRRFTFRPNPSQDLLEALAASPNASESPQDAPLPNNSAVTAPAVAATTAPDLSLAQAQALLTRPGYVFYEHGLKARLKPVDRTLLTEEPIAPESLERWQLKASLLEQLHIHLQAGLEPALALERSKHWLKAAGLLPLGSWAEPFWLDLEPDLLWISEHFAARSAHSESITHTAFTASNPLNSGTDLARLWPQHLQRCMGSQTSALVLYSTDGIAELLPLTPDQAGHYWAQLCKNWQHACQAPLPMTLKTGWAWASAAFHLPDGTDREAVLARAYKEAEKKYDLGMYNNEEVKEQPFLRWFYPEFALLEQNPQFASFATALYGPIVAELHWTKRERPKA